MSSRRAEPNDPSCGPPLDRLDELTREHDRLRSSQRRLRIAVAFLALVAALPLVSAAAAPDRALGELEVRELRIVDEAGTPRFVFTSGEHLNEALFYGRRFRRQLPPSAALVFHDADGQEQGAIAVPDRGGIVMGLDSKTGQNGAITVTPGGTSANVFFRTNRGSDHALQIGVQSDGGPYLRMTRDGERVLRLPREESGDGGSDE